MNTQNFPRIRKSRSCVHSGYSRGESAYFCRVNRLSDHSQKLALDVRFGSKAAAGSDDAYLNHSSAAAWARLCKPLISRMDSMPSSSASNIATADALTLLLHNQHALAAAIEEVTVWLAANGVAVVADNAVMAMETLDTNAKAITDAIMRIRQS